MLKRLAFALLAGALPMGAAAAEIAVRRQIAAVTFVEVSGDIEDGDDAKLLKVAGNSPHVIVVLASDGGLVRPALTMGRLIRTRGYDTAVPSNFQCVSACALIWLAGEKRFISSKGAIGFHAGYQIEDGKPKVSAVGNAIIGRYLGELKLPDDAVAYITSAPPEEVNWLTADGGVQAGLSFTILPDLDDR